MQWENNEKLRREKEGEKRGNNFVVEEE